MRKIVFAALAVLGCVALSGGAQAQGVTRLCTPLYNAASGALSCPEVGQTGPGMGTNPLPVTIGGGSSSIMTYAPATIGTGDSTIIAAPAAGATTFPDLYNLSTATVCINLGATATITGTQCDAGEILLPPGWHWSPPAPIAVAVHAIASAASAQFTVGTK